MAVLGLGLKLSGNQGYGRVYRIRVPQRRSSSTLEEPHAYACAYDEISRHVGQFGKVRIFVLEALCRKRANSQIFHARVIGLLLLYKVYETTALRLFSRGDLKP